MKKRSTVRGKIAKANRRADIKDKLSQVKAEQNASVLESQSRHQNPMLRLAQVSKKDKQLAKTRTFNEKLLSKVTFNTSNKLSKSVLRRKKRKEREQLKPKMEDLWSSLPADTDGGSEIKTAEPVFVESEKKNTNAPNATKQSGRKHILKQEHQNFNLVLASTQFRSSPFAALKDAIKHNMGQ